MQESTPTYTFIGHVSGSEDPSFVFERVITLLKEAAIIERSQIAVSLKSAYQWVELSVKYQHPTALNAFEAALELQSLAILLSRTLTAQHQRIVAQKGSRYITHDATAFAISKRNLELAIELSEQGRSTVFSQLGRYRTTLDDLRAIDKELADRFAELSHQLDRTVVSDSNALVADPVLSRPFENEVTRYDIVIYVSN